MKYLIPILICSLIIVSGCTLFGNIGENDMISECGGFDNRNTTRDDELCADEMLLWEYEQETGTVHFTNKNVWLNCCGKHSIELTKEQDTFVIDEQDKPEFMGGRCDCMCFYDFAIDLPDREPGTIMVALYRYITDESSRTQIWEGEIDLGQQQGEILIQANVGWCF